MRLTKPQIIIWNGPFWRGSDGNRPDQHESQKTWGNPTYLLAGPLLWQALSKWNTKWIILTGSSPPINKGQYGKAGLFYDCYLQLKICNLFLNSGDIISKDPLWHAICDLWLKCFLVRGIHFPPHHTLFFPGYWIPLCSLKTCCLVGLDLLMQSLFFLNCIMKTGCIV